MTETRPPVDPTPEVRACRDCGPTMRRMLGRGLCTRCYKRRWRGGTLSEVPIPLRGRARVDAWLSSMVGTPGCWPWPGAKSLGYGNIEEAGVVYAVHRLSYERFIGPIAPGLHVDHQCHNADRTCNLNSLCPHRACANPAHLEAVSSAVNTLRGNTITARNLEKTHCPAGHPYAGSNLYTTPSGSRMCLICKRRTLRAWRARAK